jgi:nucleotide-binding universal stress UspA family protein
MTKQPIVVGVDGSPQGTAAAEDAAREAALRGTPLRIVHGFIWPTMRVALGPPEHGPADGGLRHQAERIVTEAVEHAHAAEPGVEVSGEVVTGAAAQALIARSDDAAMVVVGDHGLGAFTTLLVGSVPIGVAVHARCPIMVVRGRPDPDAPIVVAIDGSAMSDPTIRFAFQEAALRGAAVAVLHVWRNPAPRRPGEIVSQVYDEALVQDEEERALADALAGWRDKFPDVQVHTHAVHGRIRRTILEATDHAQLVVVGSRGAGGLAGLLGGSVSQAVLHHAACPVVTVPNGH